MTVRVFSSARITLDEGTLDTFRTNGFLGGAWTAVCVFKRSGSTGDGTQFMFSASSSGSLRFGLSYSTASALQVTVGGTSRTFGASFTISNATWYVFAVRKAAGTATPSAKLWNAGTGAVVADWTNGSGSLDDDTNLWDELQIGNRVNDFPLNGKMGGVALFSSDVGTTVGNTFGTGLQEWLDASPVGMWALTQAATTDAVLDEVGDADEIAITGTSVDTGDDPAAFDLTFGGGGDATVTPATIAVTASLPAASVSAGSTPSPLSVAAAVALPATARSAGSTVTPSTIAASVTAPTATLSAGSTTTPATLAAAVSLPAVTVSAGGSATANPATVAATLALPAASPSAGSTATPSTIAAAAAIPAAAVSAGSTATPTAVAATATLPAVAVSASSTVTPATVAAIVAVPLANLVASSTVLPATVAATVALPLVSVNGVSRNLDLAVGAPELKWHTYTPVTKWAAAGLELKWQHGNPRA